MEYSYNKVNGLSKAVAIKMDETFELLLQQKIKDQPTWLYMLYNQFIKTVEDPTLPMKFKINKLLSIMKTLAIQIPELLKSNK